MTTDKIRKYVLPYIPYALIYWFFSKAAMAYRLSPGRDAVRKFMDCMKNLNTALLDPIPTLNPYDMLIGLTGAAAVFCIVLYKKKNAKKWRKDVEYGSARWGNKKDIEPYVDPKPENNVILTATESLMLNGRPKNPKYARNKNVLIVGGSGSGKTRFFVKPNLMQMHSSYVCTDPKGTILLECGKMLQRGTPKRKPKTGKDGKPLKNKRGEVITEVVRDKNGDIVYEPYEIKVLNTIDFSKSMRYNPFAYIRSEKDILKLVTALIANTKGEDAKSGEDFWTKAEVLLYCALIGYIHYEAEPHEKNLNSLVELINAMEVREEEETYKNAVDFMFEELAEGIPLVDEDGNVVLDENGKKVWETPPQPDHFAVRQYAKYKLAAGVVS